jgi:hypothetical protein
MSIVAVCVLELESGGQSKLFPFTTHDGNGTWVNLIGWLENSSVAIALRQNPATIKEIVLP